MPLLKILPLVLLLSPISICAQPRSVARIIDTSKTYAIVIGITDYKEMPPLKYADKDALEFYLYLRSAFPSSKDNLFLFINNKAVKQSIEDKLAYVNQRVKPGDKVFLYFSGHGDIEQRDTSTNFLFLLENSLAKNYQQRSSEVLEKKFFDEYISTWGSRKIKTIFICDACHSGLLMGGAAGLLKNYNGFIQSWQEQVKILACQPNGLSYEFSNLGGGSGTFTYYLLLGLKGMADADKDKDVSLLEIQSYLSGEVFKYVKTKMPGTTQIPEIMGDKTYTISKSNQQLLLAAKKQFQENSPSMEFRQLVVAKGKPVSVADNMYVYKSSGGAAKDRQVLSFADKDWGEVIKESYLQSIYFSFKAKLEEGNLLQPEGNSAYHYYKLFDAQKGYEPVKSEMRVKLLEALNKNFDAVLGSLYRGDDNAFNKDIQAFDAAYFEIVSRLSSNTSVALQQNKINQLFISACLKLLANDSAKILNNNFDEVITGLQQALKLDTLSPYILLQLGNTNLLAKKYEAALQYYSKYLQQLPNDEYIYYKQAMVYAALDKKSEAIRELNEAIRINKNYREAIEMLGRIKQ